MSKVIIYPLNGKVCVTWPNPKLDKEIEEIAKKSTPLNVPYKIIDASELPENDEFFDAWVADFNNPDGLGTQDQING